MASTAQDSSAPLRTEKKDEDVDESAFSWRQEEESFFLSLSFFNVDRAVTPKGKVEKARSPPTSAARGDPNHAREISLAELESCIAGAAADPIRALGATRGAGEKRKEKKKKTTRCSCLRLFSFSLAPPLSLSTFAPSFSLRIKHDDVATH